LTIYIGKGTPCRKSERQIIESTLDSCNLTPTDLSHFHTCKLCARGYNCFCNKEDLLAELPLLCPLGCAPPQLAFSVCSCFGCSTIYLRIELKSVGIDHNNCNKCYKLDPEAYISIQELDKVDYRPSEAFSIPQISDEGISYLEACYTKTTQAIEFIMKCQGEMKSPREEWYTKKAEEISKRC
jgi:hypothetical protein